MSAHTQGEWIARPDPNGTQSDWCIGLNDDVSPVDYIAVCHKRDAALIASAPKLLFALKACAAVCAGEVTNKNGLINALELARDAIKSATGAK